ncbi:MAG: hypothetical protein AB1762_04200 [Gemmatimonadota bacterium]
MRSLFVVVCALSVAPNAAPAQRRDTVQTPRRSETPAVTPPCCAVVRVEAEKSLVTARETATGFTFRFSVKNRRLLGTLKIGQPVWANFTDKTVKLKATDGTPCCAIIETPPNGALGAAEHPPADGSRKESL